MNEKKMKQSIMEILLQYQKYIQSKQDKRVYERECASYAEQITANLIVAESGKK